MRTSRRHERKSVREQADGIEFPLSPRESAWNCVDAADGVRQLCITMKTATVRDLRNHFADVAKWIEHGEQVTITRNGAAFATLAPATPKKRRKADWAARF